MENQLLDIDVHPNSPFIVNGAAKDYFLQTAKWSKIVAIANLLFSLVFLIFTIFFVLLKFSMNEIEVPDEYGNIKGAAGYKIGYIFGSVFVALLLFVILLYPSVRLLQFANKVKRAVNTNNSEDLEISIKRLRSVFRFYGIIILVSVVFYLIIFILAVLGVFSVE